MSNYRFELPGDRLYQLLQELIPGLPAPEHVAAYTLEVRAGEVPILTIRRLVLNVDAQPMIEVFQDTFRVELVTSVNTSEAST